MMLPKEFLLIVPILSAELKTSHLDKFLIFVGNGCSLFQH